MLANTKFAFNLRRVDLRQLTGLVRGSAKPRPGDLVAADVLSVGHHTRIQLRCGRRAPLAVGDSVAVAYGNRYATSQFEALVPPDLSPCDLVAAGGVAAQSQSRAVSTKRATRIVPRGLICRGNGTPANVADFALSDAPALDPEQRRPLTVAVVGTGMDSGKTTTAAALIRGLVRAGLRTAAIKVTGTAACNDYFSMADAGASVVFDIVDAGLVSTWLAPLEQVTKAMLTLHGHAVASGADAVVVEVADGLLQAETSALLETEEFRRTANSIVLAAHDSMGAMAGAMWLKRRQLPVVAVAGLVSSSHLMQAEAHDATGLPVLALDQLGSSDVVQRLMPRLVI